jgi:hypothetical protein
MAMSNYGLDFNLPFVSLDQPFAEILEELIVFNNPSITDTIPKPKQFKLS